MEHRDQEFLGVCATCLHLSSSERHFEPFKVFSGCCYYSMYIRINGILYLSFSCLFFASCKGQFLPGLLLRRECGGIDDSGDSEHSVPRSFQEPRGKLGGAAWGQRLQLEKLQGFCANDTQHWGMFKPVRAIDTCELSLYWIDVDSYGEPSLQEIAPPRNHEQEQLNLSMQHCHFSQGTHMERSIISHWAW